MISGYESLCGLILSHCYLLVLSGRPDPKKITSSELLVLVCGDCNFRFCGDSAVILRSMICTEDNGEDFKAL